MSLQDRKEIKGIPWIEKYRPEKLEDLISHTHIVGTSKLSIDYSSKEIH